MLEQYQDIWVKGKLQRSGVREVESRYEMIKAQAAKFNRPFTVLDIGANLGYFSIRLTEDFPECTVVAIEGIYNQWLLDVLHQNESDRIIALNKVFRLADLDKLADVEHFDMVLAMSVMHHIDGGFPNVLKTIRRLGEVKVIEIATEDNACGQESVKSGFIPEDAELLGYGVSHLKGPRRPVFSLYDSKTTIKDVYINIPKEKVNWNDISIESDYDIKRLIKNGKGTDWHRGINLKTFDYFNGSYPSRNTVASILENNKPNRTHGDLKIHNIILQGNTVEYIDFMDEGCDVFDDNELLQQVIQHLRS